MPTPEQPARPVPQQRGAHPDEALLLRLRAGDERAFADVVDRWSPAMLRVARSYVSTDASAEEVAQEAWLAVLRGLGAFEGRSSLRTWVFRILVNLAKTRGVRESRSVPWSSMPSPDAGPTVDPDRFRGPDDEWPGHWTDDGAPPRWPTPEAAALAEEVRSLVAAELARLPDRQRTVVELRDVHGLTSEEVCSALGVSAVNQRVLLHRGRARLRAVLEDYYRGAPRLIAR
jgi:RNA polymerase sigma-70 factor (ECF subfamily)